MESLFDQEVEPERDAFLGRIGALIALVVANADAVVDDPALIPVARAVYPVEQEATIRAALTAALEGEKVT